MTENNASGGKNVSKANKRRSSRKKAAYAAYRSSGRREINKAKNMARHLKKHPTDKTAIKRMADFSSVIIKQAGVER